MMLVDINLLPDKEKERSTLLIVALSILGAAILISFVLFLMAQNQEKQSVNLKQQLTTLEEQQAEVAASMQVSEFEMDKIALESTVAWAEAYEFDTVPLLAGLVRLLPERGFFDSFLFTGPNLATLVVQFNSANEAAYYLTRLQAADFLDDATFDSVDAVSDSAEDIEGETQKIPRYLAIYTLTFFDERAAVANELDETDDASEGGQ